MKEEKASKKEGWGEAADNDGGKLGTLHFGLHLPRRPQDLGTCFDGQGGLSKDLLDLL